MNTRGWRPDPVHPLDDVNPWAAPHDGDAARVTPLEAGWSWWVAHPEGGLNLANGVVTTAGEAGRRLARAICDAALGHTPDSGYAISAAGAVVVVFAKNGVSAADAYNGATGCTFRGGSICRKLIPAELREVYAGRGPRIFGAPASKSALLIDILAPEGGR